MLRKGEERQFSRDYVALKVARETAAKNARETKERIARALNRPEPRNEEAPSASTNVAVGQ
jgi:hypothetical protein